MNSRKLGFGLMRLPLLDQNDPASVDIESLKQMVDLFMERGFSYFDTALIYCGGMSERAVKEVLTDRYDRDCFTVTTKIPTLGISSREDCERTLHEQLERTGLGYFDYYFLHDVNEGRYAEFEQYDCFAWIKDVKARGLARNIGFSCHDSAEFLDRVLTLHPEFDVVQLQVNYLDWESPVVQSKACCEVAAKHGKPVIVMEPAKGGTLARVPQEVADLFAQRDPERSPASWAIRFAAGVDNVMLVLSGMSDLAQVEDNTSYMADFEPLSAEDVEMLRDAAVIINGQPDIPCTQCGYCIVDCPLDIPIPKYFTLYNADMREVEGKGFTPQMLFYTNISNATEKASSCIECGACEAMCPQHLPVRELLKTVTQRFEM